MTDIRRLLMLALSLILVCLAEASAQPAGAPPGTICVTPQFWCKAARPWPPGGPCSCQGPQGWVAGILR